MTWNCHRDIYKNIYNVKLRGVTIAVHEGDQKGRQGGKWAGEY